MKKKYHFYLESKKRLIEFLNKNEVPYETHTTISLNDRMEKVTEDMCVFDLYGDEDTYRKFKWQSRIMQVKEYVRLNILRKK